MFPVFLADRRKNDPAFPKYDRLRLMATGAIENHYLVPVEMGQKVSAMKKTFPSAWMIYPESSKYLSDGEQSLSISCTLPLTNALEQVCRIIEAKSLAFPDLATAMNRIKLIEHETRHENINQWEFMLKRLQNNAAAIGKRRSPEGYLLCLMLQSVICCHNGDTHRAIAFNQEAQIFAKEHGF